MPESEASRFATHELGRSVRRSPDGTLLAGGSPGRVIRLSRPGSRILDRALGIEVPEDSGSIDFLQPADSASRSLLTRLECAEMIHPRLITCNADLHWQLTFVIPVLDGEEVLAPLLASILAYGEVIVVDDGSADRSAEIASRAGARVVSGAEPRQGPAAARNRGLLEVSSETVCFLDCDCLPPRRGEDWLGPLIAALETDRSLGLVAPRVRSRPGPGSFARYERRCSPLDLGPNPGPVGAGHRATYVPSASMVGRTEALRQVNGFDPSLRFGEDVDLCRRLANLGWRVRYLAEIEVEHLPRTSLAGFAKQRFGYGSSAAALERRHPGVAAPIRASAGMAAAWVTGAIVGPVAGGSIYASSLVRMIFDLDGEWSRRVAIELALKGQLSTIRHLSRLLCREWLPLTLVGCLCSCRVRRITVAAMAVDLTSSLGIGGARRHAESLQPPAERSGPAGVAAGMALRLLDSVAYAAGLWRSVLRERTPGPLLPRLGDSSRRR